jgi:Fic family protein
MANTLSIYKRVQELRRRYCQQVVGKDALLTLLDDAEVAEQVYNSNAIENSTLSLDETEKILLQVDLDRYISERELFEAKNLARVVAYINVRAKEGPLSSEMLLLLHDMLLSNIRDEVSGRFRQEGEWVRVGNHIALDPALIESALSSMFVEYNASPDEHIIKRIARLHLAFERIHPFVDGNGRIGRVMNNYLFIREGYVPINIKFIDRTRYYDAFNEFNSAGKTGIMEELVGRALTSSYHKRLAYLGGKEIVLLSEYAKRNRISHSNLINKAQRQTIDAFLEKGKWKIGVSPEPGSAGEENGKTV